MKYYAIADLHGRYDLLLEAINKIYAHAGSEEYKIITLGDYIDRGPQSRQIIEFLIDRGDMICLKGNHEDMMMQTLDKPLSMDWWVGNGGGTTLESYGAERLGWYDWETSKIPDDHRSWLRNLPVFYETDKQVFIHAGVPEDDLALKDQDTDLMMWMLYGKTDTGGYRGKHVVHGHHQFADGPHQWFGNRGGRTDLDVFAWHEGRIVVGVFDDTQGHALEFIEVKI